MPKRAKTCVQHVRVPTELPLCMPQMVVGYMQKKYGSREGETKMKKPFEEKKNGGKKGNGTTHKLIS